MAWSRFIGEHVINIDDLNIILQRDIKSKSILFHKINGSIHGKYKKDEPSNLSIGPYHHGTPSLSAMEREKWGYLNYFIELNHERKLQDYINAINGLEQQARSCYSDEIKMDKKSFIQMLLLDGCFILMALNGINEMLPDVNTSTEQTDVIMDENKLDSSYDFNDRFFTKVLFHDLLLLENQIPFFVITKIYEIVTGGSPVSLLVKNIIQSMEDVFDCYIEVTQRPDQPITTYIVFWSQSS